MARHPVVRAVAVLLVGLAAASLPAGGAQAGRPADVLSQVVTTRPAPPRGCELGWQPSILAPAFFGLQHVGSADRSPVDALIAYPTTSTSPNAASPLASCGRYPLVVMIPGQCLSDTDHYGLWSLLASRIARAGYVVVVPKVVNSVYPWENDTEMNNVLNMMRWMRTSWEHSSILMPAPFTAVVGHSYGAMLAGRLAAEQAHPIAAYASLSGGWGAWGGGPDLPLFRLKVASLFTWGDSVSEAFVGANIGPLWDAMNTVKHKVVFPDAEHFDYLRGVDRECGDPRGPNAPFVQDVTIDMVMAFLSHYVPPEFWPDLPQRIPHSLMVPLPLQLTPEQAPYALGHLRGFARLHPGGETTATHTWAVTLETGEMILRGD